MTTAQSREVADEFPEEPDERDAGMRVLATHDVGTFVAGLSEAWPQAAGIRIPQTYTEQKGVVQILTAQCRYESALGRGEDGAPERMELERIAESMRAVTETFRAYVHRGIEHAGLENNLLRQVGEQEFPAWSTKTPASIVEKVGANLRKGKHKALHDPHRGTAVVAGLSAEAFANGLVEAFNEPGSDLGAVAFVEEFDSPHSDAQLRERSRKVIVCFPHADGEYYTGELQVHDEEGFERYRATRPGFEHRRSLERAAGRELVLGTVALQIFDRS